MHTPGGNEQGIGMPFLGFEGTFALKNPSDLFAFAVFCPRELAYIAILKVQIRSYCWLT